ncbi:divalent-cation tolerance protein CutA [Novosphingobium album (ex Hu et al. 2023)]|uniref:Divalent-cation tolerance protein CutA n=1 Tax=Novosphingobium album (ex Hu et al. 2023) TaxID=2930093 RepID=A0ABT0B4F8_9SPHN|nr:divalent-cation tolerance protein CutA [Novosphingobium album (ex Hu et al. 2023)]MCJ2179878.1 divalent-cation tolerance protein CutA [Novosphingobium album (ex Hu et al. 2023)]
MSEPKGPGAALIWCPFPGKEEALGAIHILLDEGLIACGNVLPDMTLVFAWNGERDTERETGTLLKTNTDLLGRAVLRLTELHPYDEPAVLGWHCETASPGTLTWLTGITAKA